MYGDSSVIRRLADRLEVQADEIRDRGDDLIRSSERVLWDGRAAVAMRDRMRERAAALRRTADEHDDAAGALREHAAHVDHLKDVIETIATAAHSMIEGAKSRLAALAGRALDFIDRVTPDPVDELLARFVPPPPGHRDWLDVPELLPGLRR